MTRALFWVAIVARGIVWGVAGALLVSGELARLQPILAFYAVVMLACLVAGAQLFVDEMRRAQGSRWHS